MRKTRFSEEHIIGILREQEADQPTAAVCRKHGIIGGTVYNWKERDAVLYTWRSKDAAGGLARRLQSCPAPLGSRQPDTGRVPRPPCGPCRDERSGPEI
jgi:hypothetical protein